MQRYPPGSIPCEDLAMNQHPDIDPRKILV
jgi:hypothetical protein